MDEEPVSAKTCQLGGRLAVALMVVQTGVLGLIAQWRLVDGDEAFYLIAARMVLEGRTPSVDFFYPQMPLLPYLQAGWTVLFGEGWVSGRWLSVLAAAVGGTLLAAGVSREAGRRAGVVTALLWLTCWGCLGWMPLVKTYAPTTALLLAAWYLGGGPIRPRRAFAAGAVAGLAVLVRLPVVVVLPVLLLHLRPIAVDRLRAVRLAWVGGSAAVLTFVVPFVVADLDSFLYSNLGYHAGRSGHGLVADWQQKLEVVRLLLGFGVRRHGWATIQTSLLAVLAVTAIVIRVRRRRPSPLLAIGAVLVGIGLLPTPCHFQYFAVAMPFLIGGVVSTIPWAGRFRPLLAAAALAWLVVAPFEVHRFTRTGRDLPFNGPDRVDSWRIENLEGIADRLDDLIEDGEPVLTWWPGYLVGSHGSPVAGFENHFAAPAAMTLEPAEASRVHLFGSADAARVIRRREVRFVLLGHFARRGVLRALLTDNGWTPLEHYGSSGAELWFAGEAADIRR